MLVGTAAGTLDGPMNWWRALAALVVAMALQVGVNFANDYSDGVRGTDKERKGPVRLTATGLATPSAVRERGDDRVRRSPRSSARCCRSSSTRGCCSSARRRSSRRSRTPAARSRTATSGSARSWCSCSSASSRRSAARTCSTRRCRAPRGRRRSRSGCPRAGFLLANNVRDVETDRVAGKRTLAVRIGAGARPVLYVVCIVGALVAVVVVRVLRTGRAARAARGAARRRTRAGDADARTTRPASSPRSIGTVRFQLALAVLLAARSGDRLAVLRRRTRR